MCRRFSKIFNIYASFQQKLSKCCHEVMVDNVGDRVVLPEKVVNSKKRSSPLLAVTYNATRDQYQEIHVAVVARILFSFFTARTKKKFGKHWSSSCS